MRLKEHCGVLHAVCYTSHIYQCAYELRATLHSAHTACTNVLTRHLLFFQAYKMGTLINFFTDINICRRVKFLPVIGDSYLMTCISASLTVSYSACRQVIGCSSLACSAISTLSLKLSIHKSLQSNTRDC